MTLHSLLFKAGLPVASVLLVVLAYRTWGWQGVALAGGGLVMWLLLHFTRMMQVLRRAAQRPVGTVASAVVLNARLHKGQSLLQVIGLARALGQQQGEPKDDPQVFMWRDNTDSWVRAEFAQGRLHRWELVRPPVSAAAEVHDAGQGQPSQAS